MIERAPVPGSRISLILRWYLRIGFAKGMAIPRINYIIRQHEVRWCWLLSRREGLIRTRTSANISPLVTNVTMTQEQNHMTYVMVTSERFSINLLHTHFSIPQSLSIKCAIIHTSLKISLTPNFFELLVGYGTYPLQQRYHRNQYGLHKEAIFNRHDENEVKDCILDIALLLQRL